MRDVLISYLPRPCGPSKEWAETCVLGKISALILNQFRRGTSALPLLRWLSRQEESHAAESDTHLSHPTTDSSLLSRAGSTEAQAGRTSCITVQTSFLVSEE